MLNNRTGRMVCFAVMLIVSLAVLIACQDMDRQFCMGVPVIDQELLEKYEEGLYIDIKQIMFEGEVVPSDTISNRIYVSQSADNLEHFSQLKGMIRNTNRNQSLYFIRDEALLDLPRTVKNGMPIILIVVENGYYCKLRMVLTTLPVVSINGRETERVDKNNRTVNEGTISVFYSNGNNREHVVVKRSNLEWHRRGRSTSGHPKMPCKVTLKNSEGEIHNEDLLGIGADDDWILNPMVMDDLRIREKLMMDTWNQYVISLSEMYEMSRGEYVELIMNGEYKGLYLLQRRVDAKYLDLNREKNILLKSKHTYSAKTLEEEYEIIHSPFDTETTYAILGDVILNSNLEVDSFICTDLFLYYFAAPDNMGALNMFYILQADSGGYRMHLLPWDTDMSMGITWGNGFEYDYEKSMKDPRHRREYIQMQKKYWNFDELYKQKWNVLRETAFSTERIERHIRSIQERIENSGAYQRDRLMWGTLYEGKDTFDQLVHWCKERTAMFDLAFSRDIE